MEMEKCFIMQNFHKMERSVFEMRTNRKIRAGQRSLSTCTKCHMKSIKDIEVLRFFTLPIESILKFWF